MLQLVNILFFFGIKNTSGHERTGSRAKVVPRHDRHLFTPLALKILVERYHPPILHNIFTLRVMIEETIMTVS